MPESEASATSSAQNTPAAVPWWVRLCRWLWKIAAGVGSFLVLGLGANVLATWLTSAHGIIPADSPLGVLVSQWPIVLLIGGCFLLLALLIYVLSRWPGQVVASSSLAQRNRIHLLDLLDRTYFSMR